MEMERINENTIRVSIGNDDLAERGITFLDLLGNQKQIESFFYSILEEVDVDDQFQGTEAVTFQVLPNHDGLELFISKNASIDESAEFSGFDNTEAEGFVDYLRNQMTSSDVNQEIDESSDIGEFNYLDDSIFGATYDTVFKADDFESIVELANNVQLLNTLSSLYFFNNQYYLQLTFLLEDSSKGQAQNDVSKIYEYMGLTNITKDVLDEYGELIIDRNALSILKHYFK
ncbi:adaptor protein MecA [Vagococcus sp. JNUCC 83]